MDLAVIERCYDAIPRVSADTEEIGPFTLFIARAGTGWQFYARPRLGLAAEVTPDDARRVVGRQAALGLPRAIEWVDEVTPSLLPAVREALPGASLEQCPLLVVSTGSTTDTGSTTHTSSSTEVRAGRCVALTPDHPHLALTTGAVSAAFGGGDVEPGDVGGRPALMAAGHLIVVAAYDGSGHVVGGGSAAARGATAELMGIGVAASARGQGLGTAITRTLLDTLRTRGIETAFLSAASDAVGIYRSVGFESVGTALILAVPDV